jgi:transposase-like protein
MSMNSANPNTPICPSCGRPMELARITPRLGGLPELQTFVCRACSETLTEAVENRIARPDSGRDAWRDVPPIER